MSTPDPRDLGSVLGLPGTRAPELATVRAGYEAMARAVAVGLVVHAADGGIVEVNAAAQRMLGVTPAAVSGRLTGDPAWGVLDEHGDPMPSERHPISQAFATGEPVREVVMSISRPDGSRLWVDVSADVVLQDGEVVLGFSTFIDVTRRHDLAREVQRQEERLRAIFDDSPLGIATCGVDVEAGYPIQTANAAFCRQFGVGSAAELVGSPVTDLVVPAERTRGRETLRALVVDHDGADVDEWEIRHPDGRRRWVRTWASTVPAPAEEGGVVLLVQTEDVTAQRAIREQMEVMAHHDALTGLGNRTLGSSLVEQARREARRRGEPIAVMFLDLDHFKLVNDTLGHDVGDQLLRVLAQRLAAVPGISHTPARLGGDEFLVVLDDAGARESDVESCAERVADQIIAELGRPVVLAGEVLHVGASVGIAVGTGEEDERELLRRADLAMYAAKDDGRSCHRVYRPEMRAAAQHRAGTERELQRAIDAGELRVYLQPVVDAATRAPVACEALLRWEHPERGLLGPAEFLAVAEASGLVVPIDTWVIGETCRILAELRAAGTPVPSVAVNVSGQQLVQRDVAGHVARSLAAHGLEPSALAVELTERTLIDAGPTTLRQLTALADLGVPIGLDDFGTGHSSLSNVKHLPVGFLKVDRSFVADLLTDRTSRAIVAAIIRLGTEMGLDVVAEGVEDEATFEAVRDLGCTFAQGWLFGRPVPPAALTRVFGGAPS
ncbi:MAG: EAL domain-containing protein [Nocardioidaceae bacterium]|nr:EAL domain-containing protein [Nocardioidaceae bacterium]